MQTWLDGEPEAQSHQSYHPARYRFDWTDKLYKLVMSACQPLPASALLPFDSWNS